MTYPGVKPYDHTFFFVSIYLILSHPHVGQMCTAAKRNVQDMTVVGENLGYFGYLFILF